MNVSVLDRDAMIRTVWGEARGERPIGQAAVAHVILNRAANPGWWGNSPASVCHARSQFSCWNANDPNSEKVHGLHADDPGYKAVAEVVDDVLHGRVADPTQGADHYKVKGTPASWDKVLWKDENGGVVIGNHAFYKLGLRA